MTQYYIVEIRKSQQGELEHDVQWSWDANPDLARLKAESKYYEILSQAAVSQYASHACIVFSQEGVPLMNKCYTHTAETEEE